MCKNIVSMHVTQTTREYIAERRRESLLDPNSEYWKCRFEMAAAKAKAALPAEKYEMIRAWWNDSNETYASGFRYISETMETVGGAV